MPTFESQVHAYERNHPGRPWAGTLYGPAEVTGDQMAAAMACGSFQLLNSRHGTPTFNPERHPQRDLWVRGPGGQLGVRDVRRCP